MTEPTTVTATEASRAFSDLLHRVCYGGESFIIKKGNRLMARITPMEPMEPVTKTPDALAEIIEALPPADGLTQEESDYYKTVVEQLNKLVPESCD